MIETAKPRILTDRNCRHTICRICTAGKLYFHLCLGFLLLTNPLLVSSATKAVSVCPPAYFADLLCDRARCYLYEELSGQRFTKEFDEKKSWNGTIHPNLQNTMFYI